MASQEVFEIQLKGGAVRGALHRPADADSSVPLAAILICRGLQSGGEDANTLIDELVEALCKAGLAVAVFEHRCADLILDDFDAHDAGHDVEDASAVFQWMSAQPAIDANRIGVIGYSLGAIAATVLAGRFKSLARLCLLSAASASSARALPHKGNGTTRPAHAERLPAAYLPSLSAIDPPSQAGLHDRPNLIVHGAADRVISPHVALEYLTALETAGRQVEHLLIARGSHAFALPEARAACLEQVVRFFGAMSVEQEQSAVAKSSA